MSIANRVCFLNLTLVLGIFINFLEVAFLLFANPAFSCLSLRNLERILWSLMRVTVFAHNVSILLLVLQRFNTSSSPPFPLLLFFIFVFFLLLLFNSTSCTPNEKSKVTYKTHHSLLPRESKEKYLRTSLVKTAPTLAFIRYW